MSKQLTIEKQNEQEQMGNSIQSALIEIVKRTDIDPERLEKFLDLQIKMENRQAEQAFNEALANFQGECPVITKKKKVKFSTTSYDYAPLDEIVHIIKPLLAKHGLSYTFNIESEGEISTMVTTISHKAGHSKPFKYAFNSMADGGTMNQSQRRKSAVTYAKRAGLENALGIVTQGEDDDAKRAVDNPVSDQQLATIRELMKQLKVTDAQFFDRMKISSWDDLTGYDAKNAIVALKNRRSECTK